MLKYIYVYFFIFFPFFLTGQNEDSEKSSHGTIKIARLNPDSVYVKAEMIFFKFQEGNKNNAGPGITPVNNIIPPFPKVAGNTIPFDYNQFFNEKIKVKRKDLSNKITDTIRIQIKILDNGRAYYKDMTPLMVLNGVPAYYDKKKNAYKLDDIHWKCMFLLKRIKTWEPANMVVGEKDTFKKVTVIKPKKKNLSATGILTIIFSSVPFEEFGFE